MNIKEYLTKRLKDIKSSNSVNYKSVECFISYLNELSKLEIDDSNDVVIVINDIIVLCIYDKDDSLDIGIRFEIDGTLSINKEHSFKVKNKNELSNTVLDINNLFK